MITEEMVDKAFEDVVSAVKSGDAEKASQAFSKICSPFEGTEIVEDLRALVLMTEPQPDQTAINVMQNQVLSDILEQQFERIFGGRSSDG